MGGTTIGGGNPSHNTGKESNVDQNQFDTHCENVEAAIGEAKDDKVPAMPVDVIALCDACSEESGEQEDINKVRAIRSAASFPHPENAPVNLPTGDLQGLLEKAKADFEEKEQRANDPSMRPMFDPMTGRPLPAQVGKAQAAPRGRDIPTPGRVEKFSKGPDEPPETPARARPVPAASPGTATRGVPPSARQSQGPPS